MGERRFSSATSSLLRYIVVSGLFHNAAALHPEWATQNPLLPRNVQLLYAQQVIIFFHPLIITTLRPSKWKITLYNHTKLSKPTDRPINRSINQSINLWINQSTDGLVNQSVNQSIYLSIRLPISSLHPLRREINAITLKNESCVCVFNYSVFQEENTEIRDYGT